MIQLTNEALNHLENLTKEHNKKYVRLQVKGGGCAGFEYEWSFEDEDNREDMIKKKYGVVLLYSKTQWQNLLVVVVLLLVFN